MDPIDYDAEYARLLREIEHLPPEQQESLRALHAESVRRHEEIQASREQSREALEALGDKLQSMADGFRELDVALSDLRLASKLALFELEARRRERNGEGGGTPPDDRPSAGE